MSSAKVWYRILAEKKDAQGVVVGRPGPARLPVPGVTICTRAVVRGSRYSRLVDVVIYSRSDSEVCCVRVRTTVSVRTGFARVIYTLREKYPVRSLRLLRLPQLSRS